MNSKVVSKKVYEVLLKHLVDIEERKEQLLDKYYPDITKERDKFKYILDEYIEKVEEYISSSEVADNQEAVCPFIFIGSIVELENMDDGEKEKYQIISPYESRSASDMDVASVLAPLGRALLLKRVSDKITIENPTGQFTYTVKSIDIPDEMLSFFSEDG